MPPVRSTLLLPLVLAGCAAPRGAAADRAAVLATVQAFFDAMHARDAHAAARTLVADGAFVNTRVEDGRRVEKHFSNREWIERLPREQSLLLETLRGSPTVLVAGDLATVWCAYDFSIDGKPSHAGVDAFNLVRTDAGWRISGGAYSVVRPLSGASE